jgi:hypothetical protein
MFGKRQKLRQSVITPTPLQRAQHARDPEYAAMLRDNGTMDPDMLHEMQRKYAGSEFPVQPPPLLTPGDIAWLRKRGEDDLANQMEEAMPVLKLIYPQTYQRYVQTEDTRLAYMDAHPDGE